jgi:hypothetical protein
MGSLWGRARTETGYANLDFISGEIMVNQLWLLGKNFIIDGKGFITCGTVFKDDLVTFVFAPAVEQSLAKENV